MAAYLLSLANRPLLQMSFQLFSEKLACRRFSRLSSSALCELAVSMLARLYIEALLFDEGTADAIWDSLDRGEITTYSADWAWRAIFIRPTTDKENE